jgi:hypothetical protein
MGTISALIAKIFTVFELAFIFLILIACGIYAIITFVINSVINRPR